MSALQILCQEIAGWPLSAALRESDNAFPLVETAHVLAVCLIAGSLVAVDLRLLGVLLRGEPVPRVAAALLPWAWWGFGLMTATGLPLFAAEAATLYGNPAFRLKLLLLVMAGLNALMFHLTTYRTAHEWGVNSTPLAAKAFAGASLLLWSGIIVAGRWIAVFHVH